MNWQLIDSDEALEDLLAQASEYDAVAIDTEFMRRNTFFPQVSLLQLCFSGKAWLIDPLAIKEIGSLVDFVVNPGIVKILHSASEDLEVFQQWLGVLPQPMFDTQRAAALLGRGFGLGYRAIVSDLCDVELDKGETRSDWLRRPLSESQCDYAAQDVTHLLSVWQLLRAECEDQGKTDWVFSDGRDAANALASTSGHYYKKIKSAWKLDARQLASLIAISDWRERTARTRDKPRSWIIDDKACFGLAQCDPQSWAELKSEVDLPPPALRRYGEDLLALLAQQRILPEEALPERLPAPMTAAQRNKAKKIKLAAKDIAIGLNIAPEVLLQSRDYEILVREAEGGTVTVPPYWSGWRLERIVTPLREILGRGIE